MPDSPAMSIIIPTYRRPDDLLDCLRSIQQAKNNSEIQVEVIVVDDGGGLSPQVKDSAPELPIRWLHLPQNGGQPAAQSAGVEVARSEILAFLDDDAVIDVNWIMTIYQYFEKHPTIGAVLGKIEPYDSSHVLARMRQQIYERRHRTYTDPSFAAQISTQYPLRVMPDVYLSDHISGGNFAIRRDTLICVGGIASSVRRGGDRILAQKLLTGGHALGYCPEMVIYHRHFRGYGFLILNSFRVGRARAKTHLEKGGKRGSGMFKALRSLAEAPFQLSKAADLLDADKSALKIYLNYTVMQVAEAVGQFFQAVVFWVRLNKAE